MQQNRGVVHLLIPIVIVMIIAIGAGLILTQSGTGFLTGAKGKLAKITICHIPPGNVGNPQTINVSKNAWEAGHDPHNAHSLDFVVDATHPCPATLATPTPSSLPTPSPTVKPTSTPTVAPSPTEEPEEPFE